MEEKAAAAAAKKAATMEEAKKKASAEQAAVDELSTGKQVATWLTERCEINASDAKLYADAFAQLGIDKPEDLQMVDGDEVPCGRPLSSPCTARRSKLPCLETDAKSKI